MELKVNPNRHIVKGEKDKEGYYISPCPHNAKFEYINGWGVRMVGSACCGACKHNAKKSRVKEGPIEVICLHEPGKEVHKIGISVIKSKV